MNWAFDDSRVKDSVLADFDAADVLDALSLGIIVLDSQLCAVYANLGAEELLAVGAESLRGRPLARFLPQPERFLHAVENALKRKEVVVFDLAESAECHSDPAGTLNVRIAPLRDQLSGRHLLLELCARRLRE
jgi:nitrogen-specific signal transduction histidine kinase